MVHVEMTHKAYLKMRYFVEECDEEISGFGKSRVEMFDVVTKVRKQNGQHSFDVIEKQTVQGLLVYDIEILPQIVSGVHSTIDEETLVAFLTKKTQDGESVKDYKVWWHSHVNMAAFFSGTDVGTIEESDGSFPYLLSIVTNKPGDILTRLDVFGDLPTPNVQVDFSIQEQDNKPLRNYIKREIAEKVTFSTPRVQEQHTTKFDFLKKADNSVDEIDEDTGVQFRKPNIDIIEEDNDLDDDVARADAEMKRRSGGQRGW